jgi:hypothetical protein
MTEIIKTTKTKPGEQEIVEKPVLDRHIDLPPTIITWTWARDVINSLGGNTSRVTKTWCYEDFYNAFPEFTDIFKKICEDTTQGYPSILASKMYECGSVDLDWVMSIVLQDELSDLSAMNMSLAKLTKDAETNGEAEEKINQIVEAHDDIRSELAKKYKLSTPEEPVEPEDPEPEDPGHTTIELPGISISF